MSSKDTVKGTRSIESILRKFVDDVEAGDEVHKDDLEWVAKGLTKYLRTPKPKHDDLFSKNMQTMRKKFAALINEMPKEFEQCVGEYNEHGSEYFSTYKSKKYSPKRLDFLALLLARYELRTGTKQDFFEQEHNGKYVSSDLFNTFEWGSEETFNEKLKHAKKLYKEDENFREHVEVFKKSLKALEAPNRG